MTSVLVAGLCVVDLVHRVDRAPGADEKVTARSREVVAGGPATNAAVTCAALGVPTTLLTAVGTGPLAGLVGSDLDRPRLAVVDLAGDDPGFVPNVSAVTVSTGTGERSVVSLDAADLDEEAALARTRAALAGLGADPAVVLLDGHYPAVAVAVARWARGRSVAVVLDAGRWKPWFADLLPLVDEVVASGTFTVPEGSSFDAVAARCHGAGAGVVAQTHGGAPIDLSEAGARRRVPVPAVAAVDTLGAGDVLHGAYAAHRAAGRGPGPALARAAEVAAYRCRTVGSRAWLAGVGSDVGYA